MSLLALFFGGKMSAKALEEVLPRPHLALMLSEFTGIAKVLRRGLPEEIHLAELIRPKKKEIIVPEDMDHIVVTIPGFASPGSSMSWLTEQLNDENTFATTWGDHTNFPLTSTVDHLIDLIEDLHEQTGKKVDIVGHSLGGNIGQYLSDLMPDKVGNIYALASPSATLFENLTGAGNLEAFGKVLMVAHLERHVHLDFLNSWPHGKADHENGRELTAFTAANEGIINVELSLLEESPKTRNLIVKGGHVEMVYNRHVAKALSLMIEHGNQVEFPPELQDRFLSLDQLARLQDTPVGTRLLAHFTHRPREKFKSIANAIAQTQHDILHSAANVPGSILDTVTRVAMDPKRAAHNADPANNLSITKPDEPASRKSFGNGHIDMEPLQGEFALLKLNLIGRSNGNASIAGAKSEINSTPVEPITR